MLSGVIFTFGALGQNSNNFSELSERDKVKWFEDHSDSLSAANYKQYNSIINYINTQGFETDDSLLIAWELLFKAKFFSAIDNYDSTVIYAESAIQREDLEEFTNVNLEANYLLATTFFQYNKFEDALPFYMESLNLSERVNDVEKKGMSLCKIGEIRAWFLDIENALVYFQSAEDVIENHPDKRMLVFLYNKKGRALSTIMRYQEALLEFKKSISIAKAHNFPEEFIRSHLAIGKLYTQQDSVNYAIQHYNEAIDKGHEINDERLIGEAYLEFGEFWFKINSHRKAEHYLNRAIQFLKPINNRALMAKSYLLLGQCKYKQKQYKEASRYLVKSIEMHDNVIPNSDLLEAYEMLSKVFYLSNEFEEAYHYLKISKIIGDSLAKIDNEKQINELQIRYETENNRKLISTLTEITKVHDEEQEKNKIYLYILLIGFIVVSVLSIFLYAQYALNRKNLGQLEMQNEEIRDKNKELRSATNQAKESKHVQKQFIDSVSHELKTPLTTILGTLDVLERSATDKDHKLMFENLRSSSENLLIVINELLDFSEIDKGKLELNLMQSDLHQLVTELAESYYDRSLKKGLSFEFINDENLPQWTYMDGVKLRKVLNNVLDNAVKFTHTGRIIFKTTILEKSKTFNGTLVKVEFCVKDTGVGISNDMKEIIFKSFSRETSNVSQDYTGIGLGLTISKEFIKAMGGEISFDSETGNGSEFKVVLEMKADKKAVVSMAESERKQSMARFNNEIGVLYPLEILVAEDNETNMAFIMTVLRKLGYDPVGVTNGQEVLDILRERKFDMVLMDIQMPVMDGITATKEIQKRFPKGQQPIVIAVTANAAGRNKLAYLEAGLDDFISKPFTSKMLEKLIVNWYKRMHNQA